MRQIQNVPRKMYHRSKVNWFRKCIMKYAYGLVSSSLPTWKSKGTNRLKPPDSATQPCFEARSLAAEGTGY